MISGEVYMISYTPTLIEMDVVVIWLYQRLARVRPNGASWIQSLRTVWRNRKQPLSHKLICIVTTRSL